MNILVISSYLPFPMDSGGNVRLYNLLKRLSKNHSLTLICEIRGHQGVLDVSEIEKFCKKVITIPRKKQWSLKNILMTAASPRHSFLITGHTLPEMKKLITGELRLNKYDLIHVETSYVMQNIPPTKIPIILTEHNIEYAVYQKYVTSAPWILRRLLSVDVKKLEKEEKSFWQRADKMVVVSEKEKEVVSKFSKQVVVIPNGVDIQKFKAKNIEETFLKKEKRILFIGNYSWIQNQHSLKWILSGIWPKIEQLTDQSVKLWIVGRNLPQEFFKNKIERVKIEGVSDLPTEKIFNDSFVLLTPLKVAGGTQYKILEAMAVGTPVVTTKLATEGLQIKYTKTIITSETDEDLAEQTVKLLTDESYYKVISKNSRSHIEKNFSFDSIADKLDKVYHEVAKS